MCGLLVYIHKSAMVSHVFVFRGHPDIGVVLHACSRRREISPGYDESQFMLIYTCNYRPAVALIRSKSHVYFYFYWFFGVNVERVFIWIVVRSCQDIAVKLAYKYNFIVTSRFQTSLSRMSLHCYNSYFAKGVQFSVFTFCTEVERSVGNLLFHGNYSSEFVLIFLWINGFWYCSSL